VEQSREFDPAISRELNELTGNKENMKSFTPSRRKTLKIGAAAALFAVGSPFQNAFAQQRTIVEPKRPPALDQELVKAFVGICHRDADTVRSMLGKEPGLVNASFNRGAGDWESGMEAAAHMGRPDIAHVLIEHKARKCIFWAAMAGEEAIVEAFVTADPETVNTGGAHNISLMAHAAICGKVSLTEFLKRNGARVDRKSLEHAVRGNRLEMVEWLVDNGINPKAKDIFGSYLYESAEKKGCATGQESNKGRARSPSEPSIIGQGLGCLSRFESLRVYETSLPIIALFRIFSISLSVFQLLRFADIAIAGTHCYVIL